MPTTYEKCDKSVSALATELLTNYDTHHPVRDAKVRIDFVFAYAEKDAHGAPKGPALKWAGMGALGLCRKISLKDRAQGRGDVEIALDGDWWQQASKDEQASLLDHELHHISVKTDERGLVTDDLKRPVIKLRKHDYQVGWFNIIAQRHGIASQEQQQARTIMSESGQLYWPDLTGKADQAEHVARRVRQHVSQAPATP